MNFVLLLYPSQQLWLIDFVDLAMVISFATLIDVFALHVPAITHWKFWVYGNYFLLRHLTLINFAGGKMIV